MIAHPRSLNREQWAVFVGSFLCGRRANRPRKACAPMKIDQPPLSPATIISLNEVFFPAGLAGAGFAGGGAGLGAHRDAPGHPWSRSCRPRSGGKESGCGPHDRGAKRTGTQRRTPVLQPHRRRKEKFCPNFRRPEAKVRRGWQVRVAESLGPQRVEIPNVIGQSERTANINIRRRGLDVGAIAQMRLSGCCRRPGLVASSSAQRQRRLPLRKSVCWSPHAPQAQALVMPSFVGQPLGTVTPTVQDAGLHLGTVTPSRTSRTTPSPTTPALPSPASMIVSQNPAAGEKVMPGGSREL